MPWKLLLCSSAFRNTVKDLLNEDGDDDAAESAVSLNNPATVNGTLSAEIPPERGNWTGTRGWSGDVGGTRAAGVSGTTAWALIDATTTTRATLRSAKEQFKKALHTQEAAEWGQAMGDDHRLKSDKLRLLTKVRSNRRTSVADIGFHGAEHPLLRASREESFSAGAVFRIAKWVGGVKHKLRRRRMEEMRNAVEAILQSESVVLEVDEPTEAQNVDITKQGNLDFYTNDALRSRDIIKSHSQVRLSINEWWLALGKSLCHDGMSSADKLTQHEYVSYLAIPIYKELLPGKSKRKLLALGNEDWESDSGGKGYMDYEALYQSMFELTDIWVDGISGSQYVEFLDTLFEKVFSISRTRKTQERIARGALFGDSKRVVPVEDAVDYFVSQVSSSNVTETAAPTVVRSRKSRHASDAVRTTRQIEQSDERDGPPHGRQKNGHGRASADGDDDLDDLRDWKSVQNESRSQRTPDSYIISRKGVRFEMELPKVNISFPDDSGQAKTADWEREEYAEDTLNNNETKPVLRKSPSALRGAAGCDTVDMEHSIAKQVSWKSVKLAEPASLLDGEDVSSGSVNTEEFCESSDLPPENDAKVEASVRFRKTATVIASNECSVRSVQENCWDEMSDPNSHRKATQHDGGSLVQSPQRPSSHRDGISCMPSFRDPQSKFLVLPPQTSLVHSQVCPPDPSDGTSALPSTQQKKSRPRSSPGAQIPAASSPNAVIVSMPPSVLVPTIADSTLQSGAHEPAVSGGSSSVATAETTVQRPPQSLPEYRPRAWSNQLRSGCENPGCQETAQDHATAVLTVAVSQQRIEDGASDLRGSRPKTSLGCARRSLEEREAATAIRKPIEGLVIVHSSEGGSRPKTSDGPRKRQALPVFVPRDKKDKEMTEVVHGTSMQLPPPRSPSPPRTRLHAEQESASAPVRSSERAPVPAVDSVYRTSEAVGAKNDADGEADMDQAWSDAIQRTRKPNALRKIHCLESMKTPYQYYVLARTLRDRKSRGQSPKRTRSPSPSRQKPHDQRAVRVTDLNGSAQMGSHTASCLRPELVSLAEYQKNRKHAD
eukprot:ANDGO_02810.mRNA.1 LOW QUALITY PROTEIN: hypothetical protein EMH_0040600